MNLTCHQSYSGKNRANEPQCASGKCQVFLSSVYRLLEVVIPDASEGDAEARK